MSRSIAGCSSKEYRERGLYLVWIDWWDVVFNPSVTTCHLPYILHSKTQRRRLILSDISCLSFFPAVYRSITGCCVSHVEKVARSDRRVEKHHLINSFISDIYPPRPTGTPPISSAMSRGRGDLNLSPPRPVFSNPSGTSCHLPYLGSSPSRGGGESIFLYKG